MKLKTIKIPKCIWCGQKAGLVRKIKGLQEWDFLCGCSTFDDKTKKEILLSRCKIVVR